MKSLIETYPTAIRHLVDSTLFYFGSQTIETYRLPGKSKFEIVYSPMEPYGWEFVQYQWFDAKDGLWVLGRRELEPDEIAYFEDLLTLSTTYS